MIKVINFPKYYQVEINGNTGIVKIISNSKHAKGRELSQNIDINGYLSVKMNNKNYKIHSLVAKYFLGEMPKGLCINHIDSNKLNNSASNLEYVTIRENILHAIKSGTHICNRPEQMGRYIDGRCKDIVSYKRNWYLQNRDRILLKLKQKNNVFSN